MVYLRDEVPIQDLHKAECSSCLVETVSVVLKEAVPSCAKLSTVQICFDSILRQVKSYQMENGLSSCDITFSQYVRMLHQTLVTDFDDVHFMITLVNHSVKDDIKEPLSVCSEKGTDNLKNYRRFLQSETNQSYRDFPKKTAEYVLINFNKTKLHDFLDSLIEDDDNEDAAQSLRECFFPGNDAVNCINIAEYMTLLFQQILQKIKGKKQSRTSKKETKTENLTESTIVSKADYDNKIKYVLESIFTSCDATELKKLRMLPVDINKKISDNPLLEEKVTANAIKYYKYIKQLILVKQEENSCNFDYLASEISKLYTDYKESGQNQEEIFDTITDHFIQTCHRKLGRSACEVLVSFFIQNCEVFDVITK